MNRLDITCWKIILVGGGVVIVVAEVYLLANEVLTGAHYALPTWARLVGLVAGVLVILVGLGARNDGR